MLRQGDAQVFKRYSQAKLAMMREALGKLDRNANEHSRNFGVAQRLLERLAAHGESLNQPKLPAIAYHQLGRIAQERRDVGIRNNCAARASQSFGDLFAGLRHQAGANKRRVARCGAASFHKLRVWSVWDPTEICGRVAR